MTDETAADADTVRIGSAEIAVWPAGQRVQSAIHPDILITFFADAEAIRGGLVARIHELERDRRFASAPVAAFGGTKVYHLDRWDCPEAELLDARALAFSQQLLKSDSAVIDLSWANIYRDGDYSLPHSHERTAASIVYSVDPGDDDGADQYAGRLMFVDPRVDACCGIRRGSVTTPQLPLMAPGTMILFPSPFVHCVNPYRGRRPRITLAWNIDRDVIPGSPLAGLRS
ncbi:MAG TPA: putative 2OG-Fe(II) oxygenase [Candidatus Acidoferrum sp.]|nr:putative 2OG-Fe(II) oxygenase [Candidatus Acidoferrum sp.]